MFIVVLYVSTIILCTDLGMLIVSNKLILIRIVTLLTLEVIIVSMCTLLDTTKACMLALHSILSLHSNPPVGVYISVYIFWLSLRNKLSKVKIVSVLNYTKNNHYMITLFHVFWNSAQVNKTRAKETFIKRNPKHCFSTNGPITYIPRSKTLLPEVSWGG